MSLKIRRIESRRVSVNAIDLELEISSECEKCAENPHLEIVKKVVKSLPGLTGYCDHCVRHQ